MLETDYRYVSTITPFLNGRMPIAMLSQGKLVQVYLFLKT